MELVSILVNIFKENNDQKSLAVSNHLLFIILRIS